MVMSGKTGDISQFCKLSFYEWIMYREESSLKPYLNENPALG